MCRLGTKANTICLKRARKRLADSQLASLACFPSPQFDAKLRYSLVEVRGIAGRTQRAGVSYLCKGPPTQIAYTLDRLYCCRLAARSIIILPLKPWLEYAADSPRSAQSSAVESEREAGAINACHLDLGEFRRVLACAAHRVHNGSCRYKTAINELFSVHVAITLANCKSLHVGRGPRLSPSEITIDDLRAAKSSTEICLVNSHDGKDPFVQRLDQNR